MSQVSGVLAGRVCPRCGKEDSVPVLWGLPDQEAFRLAERGLVRLGGCMLEPMAPEFACRACALEWGRESDPTADEQALAEALGVEHDQVLRVLGRGWRRAGVAGDDDARWFISGEPAQVAVGVAEEQVFITQPFGRYDIPSAEVRVFHLSEVRWNSCDVAEAVEEIAKRRRRSFRWCSVCRRPHAPEDFDNAEGSCQECVRIYEELDPTGEGDTAR